jgi:hypothetical protein
VPLQIYINYSKDQTSHNISKNVFESCYLIRVIQALFFSNCDLVQFEMHLDNLSKVQLHLIFPEFTLEGKRLMVRITFWSTIENRATRNRKKQFILFCSNLNLKIIFDNNFFLLPHTPSLTCSTDRRSFSLP